MKHPVSRDLHAYWKSLRSGGAAPERSDVDPAAIRHILAYTFVLEVTGPAPVEARDLLFRLAGTRISALFGEARGRRFDRIWSRDALSGVGTMARSVVEDRAAVVASARCGPSPDRLVDLELLLLPLRHHGRTHARILGSLACTEVPDWMGLVPAGALDLLGFRTLVDPEAPAFLAAAGRAMAPRSGQPDCADPGIRSRRFTVHDGGRPDGGASPPPPWA